MKSFKKILGLVFIVTLLSVLVACQSSVDSDNTGNSDDELEPITLSVFDSDTNPDWEDMESPIGKKITEETGVTLKPEFDVEGGQTKIPLMAASGEYPDLIVSKGATQLVDAGGLVDLAPLIEEHAPNIKKMLGDGLNRLKWSKDDPSIYVLTNAAVEHQALTPNYGAWVQHAVVKELGYPELRTLDDLKNVIKEYKELHPEIEGSKTIGLTMNTDGWRMQAAFLNSGFMTTGASDDGEYYVDPDSYAAKLHYRRPIEKEVFSWYNEMNEEGLLDPETFVQKSDQFDSKLASGRVLATIAPDYMMHSAQTALRDAGMEERMFGQYPITLNEDFVSHAYQDIGLQAGWGISISVNNPDPVRTIKFLDYLVSDETQIMLNWGLEGEHYEIVDGKRVIPENIWEQRNNDKDFLKKTGIGYNFLRFTPRWGDLKLDPSDQTYTVTSREQAIANQTDIEQEVLKSYDAEIWKDLYPSMDEFPVKPWGAAYNISIPAGSDIQTLNQRALDITLKRVPEAVLASSGEFDSVWSDFMKDLVDADIEKAEEEYSELIQSTVELWGN